MIELIHLEPRHTVQELFKGRVHLFRESVWEQFKGRENSKEIQYLSWRVSGERFDLETY